MTLTPSKRFINITTCTFTPTGGSAVPITGVKSVTFNPNVTVVKDSGDNDFYDTFAGAVSAQPTIAVETSKSALLNAVPFGAPGVLAWTENDATNGALTGGGAIIYSVANAIFAPQSRNAVHRAVGSVSLMWEVYSSDGTTSMISSTAA